MNSIFILEDVGRNNISVKILETRKPDLDSIQRLLADNEKLAYNRAIDFDGSYKPDIDESLKIINFELPSEINEAINNPLAVERIDCQQGDDLNLRALFIPINEGTNGTKIIFQRIKKQQILLANNITLLWDKSTFISSRKPGVVITNSIDAYYEYEMGTLYFKSYYWANQILNLNSYYRDATDDDIRKFCLNDCFAVADMESVIASCNNWTRKKIAYILDSNVLKDNSIDYIIDSAKRLRVNIEVSPDKQIIFPINSNEQRELLSYLADEIYKGNLTEDIYLTNSKRSFK